MKKKVVVVTQFLITSLAINANLDLKASQDLQQAYEDLFVEDLALTGSSTGATGLSSEYILIDITQDNNSDFTCSQDLVDLIESDVTPPIEPEKNNLDSKDIKNTGEQQKINQEEKYNNINISESKETDMSLGSDSEQLTSDDLLFEEEFNNLPKPEFTEHSNLYVYAQQLGIKFLLFFFNLKDWFSK